MRLAQHELLLFLLLLLTVITYYRAGRVGALYQILLHRGYHRFILNQILLHCKHLALIDGNQNQLLGSNSSSIGTSCDRNQMEIDE